MASESEEAMILGGGQIYRDALCLTDRIYLTRVDAEVPGDTFFPELDPTDWREIDRWEHPADERNDFACTFLTLDRVSPST